MKWNCESFTTPAIEKLKDLYVNDEIPDVDLAERFNIPVHRLYRLMKKEGVYKLKSRAEIREES
jgi:hypothetical protein